MMLADLIAGLGITPVDRRPLMVRICDLTEDSRTVLPGSLFVARPGVKSDGRAYIAAAVRAGATAVLTDPVACRALEGTVEIGGAYLLSAADVPTACAHLAERFYGGPSARLCAAAVTGTNGKTTIAWLIWRMLNAVGVRCGLIGTVMVDDGREVAAADMTTPPALEIARTLGCMVESGCKAVALEASSHALDQRRLAALRMPIAIFTNLTRDHLDYHGTMEAYAAAKARLFEMLPADGVAIVNADDEAAERMVRDCRAPVVRCGLGPRPEVEASARILAATGAGMRLDLRGPWGQIVTEAPLVGRYNAMNMLQAVVATHAALGRVGADAAGLREAVGAATAPPGRLERVDAPDLTVLVDYAHTDDGLRSALTAVRGVMTPPSRLWVVFGCGGDRDKGKRPKMGAAAAELADRVVVTSDNPRTERPGDIIDAILTGIASAARGKVVVQAERGRAIEWALQQAAPGDVVVIAGKGHEATQTIADGTGGTIAQPFDDRLIAKAAAWARPAGQSRVQYQ